MKRFGIEPMMIVSGETFNSGSPLKLNPPPYSLKLEMRKNLAKLKRVTSEKQTEG